MTSHIDDDLRKQIDDHQFWYHTIDLAPGVVTKGLFDLRSIVDRLPWPDVKGKRCIDIGTYDGFFAFEMEKRGAAEVVAVDVQSQDLYDWPLNVRPGASTRSAADRPGFTLPNNTGFQMASRMLGSNVQWKPINIYDLNPAELGKFDVAVCSSLLLHLRDPIRALEAVRSVCGGTFMSNEALDAWLSMVHRRMPVARFDGKGLKAEWWTANGAGHRRMLDAAGFRVERTGRPMMVEFNYHKRPRRSLRELPKTALNLAATGTLKQGVLHRAAVCTPYI